MDDSSVLKVEVKTALTLREHCAEYKVVDQASYNWAKETLEKIKASEKRVKAHYKPLKQAAHQAHKTITSQENLDLSPHKEIEKILKEKMGAFLDKYKKDDVDKGESVTIKNRWDYIIINESEIPRHYMTPNAELIRAAVKAQGKLAEQSIPGIEVKELKELAVRVR